MWGNWQGWVISGLMILAIAAMLYVTARPPAESAPAGLVPLAFKPVALPVPASVVMPSGTGDCDAGELYRQAIREYQQNPDVYQNAAGIDVSKLPAVQLVVKAAGCSRMHLFDATDDNLKQAINYDGSKPWIDALMALGQATDDAGLRLRDGQPQEARKYYQAAFALGEKLYEERVAWDELNKGLSIMSMSAKALAALADQAKDGTRVDALRKFQEQTDQYRTGLQENVALPLMNPVESYSSKFAGDIFAVAKSPTADRVWRVEAILHLGHYRWNVSDEKKGDQAWAGKELRKLETSSQDPAIRTAVQAAEGLTVEQQRMTGSGQ